MDKKKPAKKIALHKETLRRLSDAELQKVPGGLYLPTYWCVTMWCVESEVACYA